MTSPHPLAGVYAAAVTPLYDSSLDLESVPALLTFLASRGCHGVVLFGTTGEGPSFSPAERETLMRCAREARESIPGFRLIAGTGTPSLSETILGWIPSLISRVAAECRRSWKRTLLRPAFSRSG